MDISGNGDNSNLPTQGSGQVSYDLSESENEEQVLSSSLQTTPFLSFNDSVTSPPDGRRPSSTLLSPMTSISMLVHSSMEKPKEAGKRRLRSPFTRTQRLEEELYDSMGEKPNNLIGENQVLYRRLDEGRKELILRKGLCAFMYGALKVRSAEVDQLNSRYQMKSQECAARLILHALLLQSYRRVEAQLSGLMADNIQLNKQVENLCLQLRVVRHLQMAEKERVAEKMHEIGSLKTEVSYLKKILNKGKSDLEKVEEECESLERVNGALGEEKYKMAREVRCLQEKKEILQGSLEIEKKRTEKQETAIKELKKQVVDLRQQLSELRKQSDEWEEKARRSEGKNWDLQILLESRGKEVIELSQNRDTLHSQAKELEKNVEELGFKNTQLELEVKEQLKVTEGIKESFDKAETQLHQQSNRIGFLEEEIGRTTRENSSMRTELGIYHSDNVRRRRSWVTWTIVMGDPLGAIVRLLLGTATEFIIPY